MARTAFISGSRLAISSTSSEDRWRPTGGMSEASTGTGVSGLVAVVAELAVEVVGLRTTVASFGLSGVPSTCRGRSRKQRSGCRRARGAGRGGRRIRAPGKEVADGRRERQGARAEKRRRGGGPIVRGYRRPDQLGPGRKCSSTSGATSRILHPVRSVERFQPAKDQRAKRIFAAQRPMRATAHVRLTAQVGELPTGSS